MRKVDLRLRPDMVFHKTVYPVSGSVTNHETINTRHIIIIGFNVGTYFYLTYIVSYLTALADTVFLGNLLLLFRLLRLYYLQMLPLEKRQHRNLNTML